MAGVELPNKIEDADFYKWANISLRMDILREQKKYCELQRDRLGDQEERLAADFRTSTAELAQRYQFNPATDRVAPDGTIHRGHVKNGG